MYTDVVGLDISKKTIDATIVFFGKKESYHDAFLNREFGFDHLLKWVAKYSNESSLLFCLENTGYYSHAICEYLDKKERNYALVNPVKIKRSMGLRRGKSDKADSKVIALYGLKFHDEIRTGTVIKGELLDLRLLLAHRKRIQDKELAYQRHEKHLEYCIRKSKTTKYVLKDLKKQKEYLKKQRKVTETKIDEFVRSIPEIQKNCDLLQSIPGVGPMIALNVIIQTHNFKQIRCPRKFSCYCGVAPFKKESGSSLRKGTKVSHFGHKKLKKLLNFGAMNAIRNDPQMKAYYQKKVESGKSKMSVLNAIRNKLIHRMFATINRRTPYVVHQTF